MYFLFDIAARDDCDHRAPDIAGERHKIDLDHDPHRHVSWYSPRTMLTLFTIPKAFSGRIGLLQANAIGSWVRLNANCEVILFGDDPGVAEAAARFGVRHESQVTRTPQGTPVS